MAVRYDQKTKDEILGFIQDFNKKNKRGGQAAAAEKYKVTPLTISNWMKKAGLKKSRKGSPAPAPAAAEAAAAPADAAPREGKAKAKSKGKGGRRKAATPATAPAAALSMSATLGRMIAIQGEIDKLQAEFAKLKGQL